MCGAVTAAGAAARDGMNPGAAAVLLVPVLVLFISMERAATAAPEVCGGGMLPAKVDVLVSE